MTETKCIPLDQIRTDGGTQPRTAIDMFIVEEYAADLANNTRFPPGEAVFDGVHYWLWDGFHRYHGHRKAGRGEMEVNVRPGTVEDARWLSLGANRSHGLRRKPEDIQRAIKMALEMKPDTPDGVLAEHIGVARTTVLNHRKQLEAACQVDKVTEKRGRDGKVYDTSNIGKAKPPTKVESEPEMFAAPSPEPETGPAPLPPTPTPAIPFEPPTRRLIKWWPQLAHYGGRIEELGWRLRQLARERVGDRSSQPVLIELAEIRRITNQIEQDITQIEAEDAGTTAG